MKYNISTKHVFYALFCLCAVITAGIGFTSSSAQTIAQNEISTTNRNSSSSLNKAAKFDSLIEKATASPSGKVRVIVGLNVDVHPENVIGESRAIAQRAEIKQAQIDLLDRFQSRNSISNVKQFEFIPYLAMQTDAATLAEMKNLTEVTFVQEDELRFPTLERSTAIIKAPNAWQAGFSGQGRTVAVMDTGVDKTHPFFGGRIISEACYSTNDAGEDSVSVCPGGVAATTATNSGVNCDMSISEACHHGTHVAGIVGGRDNNINRYGVARDASLISIQVFTKVIGAANCAGAPTCIGSYPSDQIKGLERIYALRNQYTIDSVNVSIGGGRYFNNCDTEEAAYKAAVDLLRGVNIATVIAAGNDGFSDSLAAPACISSAVSVGSTGNGNLGTTVDAISSFSNSAPFLTLLAPGEVIDSSVPGGGYEGLQGTSMAAPHVAGAWAIIKQKNPTWTVDQVLQKLQETGKPIRDSRNNVTKKRIRVDLAANILPPVPSGACANATPIAYNVTVNAQLQNGGCVVNGRNRARYSFYGVAGQQIYITMNSSAFDTYLYLDNSIYDTIEENDDHITFVDLNSRIPQFDTLTLPTTGMYYISASSSGAGATGAFSLKLNGTPQTQPTARTQFDFDGDGKSDVSVFRPSTGAWYLQQSMNGFTGVSFGANGDKIVPADYDGDGKTDVAVFRNGTWYLQRSSLGFTGISFGAATDVPMPADYDGDGKADVAVFRPSTGTWYLQRSSQGFTGVSFGASSDVPVTGDYDGDGKADVAVFRPATGAWYLNRSQLGFTGVAFGQTGDKPVPADYDGDGKTDVAVFRTSSGAWYLQQSTNGFTGLTFGVSTDTPVPADYDGDGKADVAVFRNGTWYLSRSTSGFTGVSFGAATDKPTPSAFIQ